MPVPGSRSGRALRRSLSASLAAAISASLLALPTPALAATVTARDLDSACPPGHVPSAGFRDTAGTTFEDEIDCVVGYAVARGTSTSTFDPHRTVTRGQMAGFLANVLVASGRTRPADLPDAFRDDDGTFHEANIDWLAAEGVLGGFGDGSYRPGATVTRAQMASFLNNLLREVAGSRLTSSTDHFSDDDGNPHEAHIDGLASRGIVTGTGDDRYSPHGSVTRQQMAGFLAREIDHLVDEGHIEVPFGPEALSIAPATAVRTDVSDNTATSAADRGARDYTVSVPLGVERVDIALLPAGSVVLASDGTPRFTSNAPIVANAGTGIEQVNGVTVDLAGGTTDVVRVPNVVVRSGAVTFRVDSVVVNAVVPVVWIDTVDPTQDKLDLETGATASTPKPAREAVAVGGAQSWGPPEPAKGTNLGVGTVRDVNVLAGWYTLDTGGNASADHLLRFSSADTYAYTASAEPKAGSPGPITASQFQTWVSAGDRLDPGAYDPGKMSHTVVGDVPAAPGGVAGVVQPDGKVKVTFTKPSNPVADDAVSSYRLERAPVVNSTVGSFAEVASRAANLAAEFVDAPATGGTYQYRVIARSVTGSSPASGAVQAAVVAPAPSTTASSLVRDSGPANQNGANGLLDRGDELRFVFDRAPSFAGGWRVELIDADGTRFRLDNTTAVPSGLGTTTVTLTMDKVPTILGGGDAIANTTGFLQVIATSGIGNATGAWNLARSGLTATGRVPVGTAPAAPTGLSLTASSRVLEAGRNEVQTVSPATGSTTGTWKLQLGTGPGALTTAALNWNATAAEVQAALVDPAVLGAGTVVVTGGPVHTTALTITFQGSRSAENVGQLTVVDAGSLDGTAPVGATSVEGVAAGGIAQGDAVVVHDLAGQEVARATAGPNGRTTLTLPAVAVGQQFHVVIEQIGGRRSATQTVTAV